jgi:hypothetical protein
VIVGSEHGSEEPDGREVYRGVGQASQDDRKAPGGPRHLDAVVGLVLGEAEHLAAIGEERGEARGPVEAARVQLRQVRDQLAGGLPLAADEVMHRVTSSWSVRCVGKMALMSQLLSEKVRVGGREPDGGEAIFLDGPSGRVRSRAPDERLGRP